MGCCIAPPRHHHPNYCAPIYGPPAVIVSPAIHAGLGFRPYGPPCIMDIDMDMDLDIGIVVDRLCILIWIVISIIQSEVNYIKDWTMNVRMC